MSLVKRIFHEEVHYAGQEPSLEERYELADGVVSSSVSFEEIEKYTLHLEEQLTIARLLLERKEEGTIKAEKYFKELGD